MLTFADPIVGGVILIRAAIQSPDYVPGSTGWAIKRDGTAELNGATLRGPVVENAASLWYAGTPGLGTLAISIAAAAGSDQYGNAYPRGFQCQQAGGVVVALVNDGQISISQAGFPGASAGPTGFTTGGVTLDGQANKATIGGVVIDGTANYGYTDTAWRSAGALPTGFSGTLKYRRLLDGTVMVLCQCTVSTAAVAGNLVLFSGQDAAHTASVTTRGPVGCFINGGSGSTAAQLAAIHDMRWSANTDATITLNGFVGGAAGSGVTELDFCAVYPVI